MADQQFAKCLDLLGDEIAERPNARRPLHVAMKNQMKMQGKYGGRPKQRDEIRFVLDSGNRKRSQPGT